METSALPTQKAELQKLRQERETSQRLVTKLERLLTDCRQYIGSVRQSQTAIHDASQAIIRGWDEREYAAAQDAFESLTKHLFEFIKPHLPDQVAGGQHQNDFGSPGGAQGKRRI